MSFSENNDQLFVYNEPLKLLANLFISYSPCFAFENIKMMYAIGYDTMVALKQLD